MADLTFHDRLLASLPAHAPAARGGFAYKERLSTLAKIIQAELPHIRATFPEFTPHDWDGHVLPLFDIAERLFGAESLFALSDLDRFLLACGLYGHDWGMAVGAPERLAIAAGAKNGEHTRSKVLIDSEHRQLAAFARTHGLRAEKDGSFPILLDDALPHWPEYVRVTHAWRSGQRVYQHLIAPDGDDALAEAGQIACEGHWMDFDQLRDGRRVWQCRMVGNTRAHIRLIALLVRLTDLFDIGRDRTSFALRRFIGPTDAASVREWDKHAALDPIDCSRRSANRWQVVVRGRCHSASLWPALCDLHQYLDEQLKGAVGLLAEEQAFLVRERPELDADLDKSVCRIESTMEWDVRAERFRPINVRFEFDRTNTFKILSQEIYGAEPMVFLRELLQNAIDATHQLRTRLKDQKSDLQPAPHDYFIRFHVDRASNGNITVKCRDYGIGMNEHIVTHYLARIGSSYYTSAEFLREDISMDAISRFGIGLLSCFMVSEKLCVCTRRPTQFGGDDSGLRIEVSGINRHFHVYPLEDPEWQGTEVAVEVLESKLRAFATKEGLVADFDIVEYLQHISGFVEFPIYIEDGSKRVLILHPKADPSIRLRGVPVDAEVRQVDGGYRWPDELQAFVMCPEPAVLSDYRVDIARDLNFPHIEGFVTFPMPCTLRGDMRVTNNGLLRGENMSVLADDGTEKSSVVSKSLVPSREYRRAAIPEGQLKKKVPSILVYQDGIYVEGSGEIGQKVGDDPFPAHAWLNYASEAKAQLRASRDSFAREPKQSPEWMIIHARTHAFRKEISQARLLPPTDRLRRLIFVEKFLGVGNISVAQSIPWTEFPAALLLPSGKFEWRDARNAFIGGRGLYVAPRVMADTANAERCFDALFSKASDIASGFQGETWLFEFPTHIWSDSVVRGSAAMLQRVFLDDVLCPIALRFVRLPKPFHAPQPQEIRMPRRNLQPENVRPLMAKALSDARGLSSEEWARLRVGSEVEGGTSLTRHVFEFPQPFADHFAFGLDYFNLRHPTVQWLVRVAAAGTLAGGINAEPGSAGAFTSNWLRRLKPQADCCYEVFEAHWQGAGSMTRLSSLAGVPIPPCPGFDEFIPGSLLKTRRDVFEHKSMPKTCDFLTAEPWGMEWQVEN